MQPGNIYSLNPPPGLSPPFLGFPITPRAAARFTTPVRITSGSSTDSSSSTPHEEKIDQFYSNMIANVIQMESTSVTAAHSSSVAEMVTSMVEPIVHSKVQPSITLRPSYEASTGPGIYKPTGMSLVGTPQSGSGFPMGETRRAPTEQDLQGTFLEGGWQIVSSKYQVPISYAPVRTAIPRFPMMSTVGGGPPPKYDRATSVPVSEMYEKGPLESTHINPWSAQLTAVQIRLKELTEMNARLRKELEDRCHILQEAMWNQQYDDQATIAGLMQKIERLSAQPSSTQIRERERPFQAEPGQLHDFKGNPDSWSRTRVSSNIRLEEIYEQVEPMLPLTQIRQFADSEKLKGSDNYRAWSKLVRMELQINNMIEVIGSPIGSETNWTQRSKIRADAIARSFIRQAVLDPISLELNEARMAYDMWMLLRRRYSVLNSFEGHRIINEVMNMKADNYDSAVAFIRAVQVLRERCEAAAPPWQNFSGRPRRCRSCWQNIPRRRNF